MSAPYSMRLQTSDLTAAINKLRATYPAVAKRALLRAGMTGRTEMGRAIAEDTGLSSRTVVREIKIIQVGDAGLQIEVQGTRLPLIAFGARGPEPSRGRGRGVSYRLKGGQGRAPTAFIATMGSGHRGVFARQSGARFPIAELHGPSLVRVFEKYLPVGAKRAHEALIMNLRREILRAARR